jgi:hypothetical protein
VTSGDHLKYLSRFRSKRSKPRRRPLFVVADQIERLLWLAIIYHALGYTNKTRHRIQHARGILPEFEKGMVWFCRTYRFGRFFTMGLNPPLDPEEGFRKTLTEFAEICVDLEGAC